MSLRPNTPALAAAYRLSVTLPVRTHSAEEMRAAKAARVGGRDKPHVERNRREAIREMRGRNMRQKEIAKALGISPTSVSKHCKAMGIKSRRGRPSA